MKKIDPQDLAALAVLGEILIGRDQAVQISIEKLAEICGKHDLASDLPPISCGLEQVWRTRLRRVFALRSWTISGRRWSVRCPWDGNFRIEPVRRRVRSRF